MLVNMAINRSPSEINDEPDVSEDSDDWLNIDAQDFDTLLSQKMGLSHSTSLAEPKGESGGAMHVDRNGDANDDGGMSAREVKDAEDMLAREQALRLQDLAKRVEKFLGGKGDVEGAKFEE